MAVATFDPRRDGAYLGENAGPNIVNEEIILVSGAPAMVSGTVLGKITASGKYTIHDPAASDGTQAAAAILFTGQAAALTADKKAVATVNGPATINGTMLSFKSGTTDAQKKTAWAALRAKGMKVLPQHAGA